MLHLPWILFAPTPFPARGAPIRGAPVRRHGSPPDFRDCSASPSHQEGGSLTRPLRISNLFLTLLFSALLTGTTAAETLLETRKVTLSQNLKPGDRSGRLRFLGMLE